MYYYVYQTTNNINGKIYIGVHRTENINDGYKGSGSAFKHAVAKYGIENFTKEILQTCENPEEMFEMESQIVTENFIKLKTNYNLIVGGRTRVEDHREIEYFKSGEHTENAQAAQKKAVLAAAKKKDERINAYYTDPKRCKHCDDPIDYGGHNQKEFCGSSCSATFNNTGRIVSDKQKENTSNTLKSKRTVSDEQLILAVQSADSVAEAFRDVGLGNNRSNYERVKSLIGTSIETAQTKRELRIKKIKESNIDVTKHGWVKQVAELIGIQSNRAGIWVKTNMPELYKECYRRKSIN